jgi:riboflavin synthase
VVKVNENEYTVTAISETLHKTNLGLLKVGELVNLERSMVMNGRIDGHIVQGHIDTTAVCTRIDDMKGSWLFSFEYDVKLTDGITVSRGSVCINGVSLTVVDSKNNTFSVAIIPYTFEHTNFGSMQPGTKVNVEFDILGKYVAKYLGLQK